MNAYLQTTIHNVFVSFFFYLYFNWYRMEGIINFELFVISAVVLVVAKGPDFLGVTTRGIADGNRVGVVSALRRD